MKIWKTAWALAALLGGVFPLVAENSSDGLALEPSTTVIYPKASDVIPGNTAPKSEVSPKSPAVPVSPTPASGAPESEVVKTNPRQALNPGWYLRFGPWKTQEEAKAAYPDLFRTYGSDDSPTTWSLQALSDGSWSLLAGPVSASNLSQALASATAPFALYRP